MDEKVEPVRIALQQVNVAAAARAAEVSESTLRYDLNKLDRTLPEVLVNRRPGPKPGKPAADTRVQLGAAEAVSPCLECGGRVRKNGTYWVLNWAMMLMLGWIGVQRRLIQCWRFVGTSPSSGNTPGVVATGQSLDHLQPLQVEVVGACHATADQVRVCPAGVGGSHRTLDPTGGEAGGRGLGQAEPVPAGSRPLLVARASGRIGIR
jgi:hypothetical protein